VWTLTCLYHFLPIRFSFWTLMALECSLLPFLLKFILISQKKPTLFTSFRIQTSCLGDSILYVYGLESKHSDTSHSYLPACTNRTYNFFFYFALFNRPS
jgi:hypothetical protein